MWLIPTRNRPAAMRALIAAMRESGCMPTCAVMIDGPGEPYKDVKWPASWHVHVSDEHLEMQRALNALFALHPNEDTYGLLTDHARPRSAMWATEMERSAGQWNVAFCDDVRNRRNPVTGYRRITAATCLGGELARALGYVWPSFCVHLYGDDALEDIAHELDIAVWREDIEVNDLHFSDGEIPVDENHFRVWKGKPYAHSDCAALKTWRADEKPQLIARLSQLIPQRAPHTPHKVTVACVRWGDLYGPEYVTRLHAAVRRHLSADRLERFVCFTDKPGDLPRDGIKVKWLLDGPRGWWSKLALFAPGAFAAGERVLYLDLDTLITGSLDRIASYQEPFACLRDFFRRDGLGSGVMAWTPSPETEAIWTAWLDARCPMPAGGDQAWIEQQPIKVDRLQDIYPGQIVSYKEHCWYGPPTDGVSVVCFHGAPKPHERLYRNWVRQAWAA